MRDCTKKETFWSPSRNIPSLLIMGTVTTTSFTFTTGMGDEKILLEVSKLPHLHKSYHYVWIQTSHLKLSVKRAFYLHRCKCTEASHWLHAYLIDCSNRCACYLQLSRYSEARDDAESCTMVKPTWPKGTLPKWDIDHYFILFETWFAMFTLPTFLRIC